MSAKAYETLSKSNELTPVSEAAQSPEQRNDDEKERKKRIRGTLIKFGSLAVFAFIVWVFATISWFSSNRTTTAGGMGISVQTDKYQIYPVSGSESIYENYLLVDSIKSSDALAWNMTSDSNMKNYDSATDSGISPGSYGSLSFLVKPKDASINLDLTFQIVGYTYTAESTDEVTNEVTPESMEPIDNDDISAYLGGHIFLFQKRNIEYYKDGNNQDTDKIKKITYSDPILPQNGSYNRVISDRTFTKATEDTPVVIYWVWPKTLSTLVDAHENDNVSIEPFCSPSSTSYSSIVTDIKTNPTRYFYGYDSNGITLTEDKLVSDYDYYGSMYDQADNEIGKGVNFITVKMTTNESVVAVSP